MYREAVGQRRIESLACALDRRPAWPKGKAFRPIRFGSDCLGDDRFSHFRCAGFLRDFQGLRNGFAKGCFVESRVCGLRDQGRDRQGFGAEIGLRDP